LAHTEILRRERLERRQKKAEEASPETATREFKEPKPPKEEAAKVLVGNLIGEDHVNYVLMYNMLTGIRIGVSSYRPEVCKADMQVSRCQAKIKRPLTDEDYVARHKFSFDM
jgi:1-phosphatidylinositol-4-phosphate 5-kinase